jgi:hypothetical protein
MDPQTFQYHSAYSDHGTQEESSQKAMTSLQSQGTIPRSIPRSLFAKQWKASQILASIFCFVSFFGSTWAFWKSGYRNCDNESPYGQAYRSGLYSGVICVFAHATAYGTWADSGTLDTKVILTNEAKRRRIVRMPVVVQIAAFSQVVAAGMNAMAVHRTVSLLGESHLVPITATVATYVRFQDWIRSDPFADFQVPSESLVWWLVSTTSSWQTKYTQPSEQQQVTSLMTVRANPRRQRFAEPSADGLQNRKRYSSMAQICRHHLWYMTQHWEISVISRRSNSNGC